MKNIMFFLLCVFVFCSCESKNDTKTSSSIPTVYTTFYPTAYFTSQIASDHVNVICPVPEDEDAIFWEAYKNPEIITKYQEADLIILNGAKFAKWVDKVSLPQEKIIDTAKPFEAEFITIEDAITHSHGNGEHTHAGLDGHTWVDPVNAKIQANEIKKALQKLLPQHKESFQKNYDALCKQLDELIHTLKVYQNSSNANKPILASHPAYNYIARRFNWNIKNLDIDPEEIPDEATLQEIKEILNDHPAKYIVWEGTPTSEIVKKFEELGLKSVVFSPCELLSKHEEKQGIDYMSVMRENLKNIEEIWK